MYISDLMYLNKRTIQTIDGILTNSSNSPIIIIQSDHGPDIYMDRSSESSKCMKERFSILNAYHLPNGGSSLLKEDISPVNTFALIFNYYLGTHFELLPNHFYYATWVNSFPYADVSDISQSCELP